MEIEVTQEPSTALVDYARISCAFQVQHVLGLLGEVQLFWYKDLFK
jgi:hypothetical protein